MKKALRLAWKLYSVLGAAALTGALALLAGGAAAGKVSPQRLEAVRSALVAPLAPPPTGERAAPAPETAPAGAESAPPLATAAERAPPRAILQEIQRASEDLRLWEDRLDLLSGDLREHLIAVGKKDRTIQDRQRSWDRVKKAMVPLLNDLLAGSPGWQPITEDDFLAAITAEGEDQGSHGQATSPEGAAPAGASSSERAAPEGRASTESPPGTAAGRPSVADLLDRLRWREASFAQATQSLRSLAPEVLAGILAAGLKGASEGGAGTRDGGSRPADLGPEEAARFVATLEAGKMGRVFKTLREDDPGLAASLLALILHKGQKVAGLGGSPPPGPDGVAQTGGEPTPAAEAVEGGNRTHVRSRRRRSRRRRVVERGRGKERETS